MKARTALIAMASTCCFGLVAGGVGVSQLSYRAPLFLERFEPEVSVVRTPDRTRWVRRLEFRSPVKEVRHAMNLGWSRYYRGWGAPVKLAPGPTAADVYLLPGGQVAIMDVKVTRPGVTCTLDFQIDPPWYAPILSPFEPGETW